MPTIGETFYQVKRNTTSLLDCDLYLLLCEANGFENNSVLLTNFNKPMQNRDIFLENVAKLKQNIPVEYILGWSNFNKIKLKVNKDVLIPRVETEELVNKTFSLIKDKFKEDFSLLDVGTGSGAIAISIKKEFPSSHVFASDISPLALKVAKENATNNNAEITFLKGDMLKPMKGKADVIISNPPYIENINEIDKNVLENEPHLALIATPGTKYYEEILSNYKKYTNEHFLLAFEIGYDLKEKLTEILNKLGLLNYARFEKDIFGKDRFLFVLK